MYYEEKWIDGKLHWRGTPTGEWVEADAEKLHRTLRASLDALEALRIASRSAVARFNELAAEMPQDGWRTATERRALISRDRLLEALNG